VINSPAGHHVRRVLDMQHLMIKDIFHYKLRNGRVVKRAAYDNRAVDVIVVAQDAPRRSGTPGEHRTLQHPFEVFPRSEVVIL
jgi:hypothetical protein